jgi:hypothetical protein
VSADWVRDRISDSRSNATVVLVDCCFSGSFIKGMRARSGGQANVGALVRDLAEGSGVAVLTASGTMEVSFEDADSIEIRPSYFTQALVTGISTGAADMNRDGLVTVDELYDYVYEQVVSGPSPQRPQRFGMGEGTLVVADAPHSSAAAGPTPERRAVAPAERRRTYLGFLSFDGQWVVVGLDGIGQSLKGERRYHVSQLSGTAFKPASRMFRGYFQVLQKGQAPAPINRWGSNPGTPNVEAGDAVMFGKGANNDIQRIRDAIEGAIGAAHGRPRVEPTPTNPSPGPPATTNALLPPSLVPAPTYPPARGRYPAPLQPVYPFAAGAPIPVRSSAMREALPWIGRAVLWLVTLAALLFEVAAIGVTASGGWATGAEAVAGNLVFLVPAAGLVWFVCWDLRRLTRRSEPPPVVRR